MDSELSVTNIAAYHFAPLSEQERQQRQQPLLEKCKALKLRGSLILAPEGINCFLAGEAAAVEEILSELRSWEGFAQLHAKYSYSSWQPFRRMLVKLKQEIIPFAQEGIDPVANPAPRLSPQQLKAWYDEGKEFVLLDTRNEFEVRVGTFEGAFHPNLEDFRSFPELVKNLPEEIKGKPVVTFCTGGVRCEKAAPWMLQHGFEEVYQLDGGILNYFEQVGGEHWQGECFVFDDRVALNAQLEETDTVQCYACQEPLSPEQQRDERYVLGESCPYCYDAKAVSNTLGNR